MSVSFIATVVFFLAYGLAGLCGSLDALHPAVLLLTIIAWVAALVAGVALFTKN